MSSDISYVVGIDLGTTTCALSYIDINSGSASPQTFAVPQWCEEGRWAALDTLPSFLYFAEKGLIKRGETRLPFHSIEREAPALMVGSLAKSRRLTHPDRVIHGAKSWLCHGGVDRRGSLLPWDSDTIIGSQRISPVDAIAAYAEHLKQAWNAQMPVRCEDQLVVVTVPASFDENAIALTVPLALILLLAVMFPMN